MGDSFPLPDALSSKVVVYLTPWCPYCNMAKSLLTSREIRFESVDVTGNTQARAWLRKASGQHTVPQIFIEGKSIGGFTELEAMDRSGRLASLLA
ncbi:glutathione S-transferase N-terminal domain-containing protein [Pseudenhygromyxa sp. WMMC2535]|uniref:glutaredoxin domain-containing protein n=1 Tax=Pseudenhygromyxa sp. WMMC2535 TaxID=2712867 RepID=UPI0015568FA5|nr:glutaredoxin domain-containing protein [Pseudenhygromyxa sp. WMMC2535]NVB38394.1 glutathione S-transferase N-terminal domain-containing protein [Pseudenhygromyxa sp. WMMC2535]